MTPSGGQYGTALPASREEAAQEVASRMATLSSLLDPAAGGRASPVGDDEAREALRQLAGQAYLHPGGDPARFLTERAEQDPRLGRLMVDGGVLGRVARDWGEGWERNDLSFVDVTVGAARLQSALRRLGRRAGAVGGTGCLLLVVPAWEGHQIAPLLAAEAMRARGADIRVLAGMATADEVLAITGEAEFDGLLTSVGTDGARDRTLGFAASVRAGLVGTPPLIVGGPALSDRVDTIPPESADCVTNDPTEALAFCGLPTGQVATTSNPETAGRVDPTGSTA